MSDGDEGGVVLLFLWAFICSVIGICGIAFIALHWVGTILSTLSLKTRDPWMVFAGPGNSPRDKAALFWHCCFALHSWRMLSISFYARSSLVEIPTVSCFWLLEPLSHWFLRSCSFQSRPCKWNNKQSKTTAAAVIETCLFLILWMLTYARTVVL